ncbi:MAG: M15 family metallopeptidase [Lachnospiraceae bacterium]|nr:M15 family metallopeptidase [Lachnospiraceae bacterium]
MQKKLYEKIKDYFINLGKKHRILLPIAICGLFVTMFITRIILYCKRSAKRFACTVFIICCFFLGSSFAFPIFNQGNGFVSTDPKVEDIAAANSNLDFASEHTQDEVDEDEADMNVAVKDESGQLLDEDLVYLDDMLENFDSSEGPEEEELNEDPDFSADDWKLILINKQHPIPEDYEFVLGELSGSMKCDERIVNDLLSMVKAAKEEDIKLVICSPYRDLDRQKMLFERKIKAYMKKGYSYLDAYKLSAQVVTVPGSSEHQVGLAIDIVTDSYTYLDEGFADTDAGKWLKEHCKEYGFILRYPEDKEYITGIEFEPWHFRYVGRAAASVIMEDDICLEEFWERYL